MPYAPGTPDVHVARGSGHRWRSPIDLAQGVTVTLSEFARCYVGVVELYGPTGKYKGLIDWCRITGTSGPEYDPVEELLEQDERARNAHGDRIPWSTKRRAYFEVWAVNARHAHTQLAALVDGDDPRPLRGTRLLFEKPHTIAP